MLHDEVSEGEGSFRSSGLSDRLDGYDEWIARFENRITEAEIDEMYARQMERQELENVDPIDNETQRRINVMLMYWRRLNSIAAKQGR